MQEILDEEENLIQLFELDNQFHRLAFDACNKKSMSGKFCNRPVPI